MYRKKYTVKHIFLQLIICSQHYSTQLIKPTFLHSFSYIRCWQKSHYLDKFESKKFSRSTSNSNIPLFEIFDKKCILLLTTSKAPSSGNVRSKKQIFVTAGYHTYFMNFCATTRTNQSADKAAYRLLYIQVNKDLKPIRPLFFHIYWEMVIFAPQIGSAYLRTWEMFSTERYFWIEAWFEQNIVSQ